MEDSSRFSPRGVPIQGEEAGQSQGCRHHLGSSILMELHERPHERPEQIVKAKHALLPTGARPEEVRAVGPDDGLSITNWMRLWSSGAVPG